MAATYHRADSENGDHIDDPSEDAIFMLIDDLNDSDSTFVVIQPDEDDPTWYVSVAVLDTGEGYEVVCRDTRSRERDVTTSDNISDIAHEIVLRLKGRSRPRPTS
ncbi:hypothetical protein [Kitasatospora sp. GP82]|uniref:hypothetical protein n=1 Tax=Kitasatospora sp. GP82 TaxID=3035089 RepID=UPI002474D1DD|nr:hypothetical protein [Kitasatospora sp. GP82]MDH6127001.1 hypothetical protein [Kitasatospora sp. GP82]